MPHQLQKEISGYIQATEHFIVQDIPHAKYPLEWEALAHAIFHETNQVSKVNVLNISKNNSSWNHSSWKNSFHLDSGLLLAIELQGYIPAAHLRELLLRVKRLFQSLPDRKIYFTVLFANTGSSSMKRLYPCSQKLQKALKNSAIMYKGKQNKQIAA